MRTNNSDWSHDFGTRAPQDTPSTSGSRKGDAPRPVTVVVGPGRARPTPTVTGQGLGNEIFHKQTQADGRLATNFTAGRNDRQLVAQAA